MVRRGILATCILLSGCSGPSYDYKVEEGAICRLGSATVLVNRGRTLSKMPIYKITFLQSGERRGFFAYEIENSLKDCR